MPADFVVHKVNSDVRDNCGDDSRDKYCDLSQNWRAIMLFPILMGSNVLDPETQIVFWQQEVISNSV